MKFKLPIVLACALCLLSSCDKINQKTVLKIEYYLAGNEYVGESTVPVLYRDGAESIRLKTDDFVKSASMGKDCVYSCGYHAEGDIKKPMVWKDNLSYELKEKDSKGNLTALDCEYGWFNQALYTSIGCLSVGVIDDCGVLYNNSDEMFRIENKDSRIEFTHIMLLGNNYVLLGGYNDDSIMLWNLHYNSEKKEFSLNSSSAPNPQLMEYEKYSYELSSICNAASGTVMAFTRTDKVTGETIACYYANEHLSIVEKAQNGSVCLTSMFDGFNLIFGGYALYEEDKYEKACCWSQGRDQDFSTDYEHQHSKVFQLNMDYYGNTYVATDGREKTIIYLYSQFGSGTIENKHSASFKASSISYKISTEVVKE